jgi:hypothetical protein
VVSLVLFGDTTMEKMSVPEGDDYTPALDMYGGSGLDVNMPKEKARIQKFLDE